MDYRKIDEYYSTIMNQTLAFEVKKWRVDEKCSWSEVHKRYQDKYVDKSKWGIGEQIVKAFGIVSEGISYEGMILCQYAKQYLNDDDWD